MAAKIYNNTSKRDHQNTYDYSDIVNMSKQQFPRNLVKVEGAGKS